MMDRLKSDSVGGGNIVIAEAFFRNGTTYYKVTRRIDSSNLPSLAYGQPESLGAANSGIQPPTTAPDRHRARRP